MQYSMTLFTTITVPTSTCTWNMFIKDLIDQIRNYLHRQNNLTITKKVNKFSEND